MFGKLARAVLNLDSDRRNNLLQRTILPGLLDGDANGKVLRDFPDMDLAESICLLLDLETAAPEVLSAALNRLDVSTERRAALVPLIEERMRTTHGGGTNDISLGSSGVERHARELIRIDAARETDFSEFAAFDLSMRCQMCARESQPPMCRWPSCSVPHSWCESSAILDWWKRFCVAPWICLPCSSAQDGGTS
jgi:hypothetical protein